MLVGLRRPRVLAGKQLWIMIIGTRCSQGKGGFLGHRTTFYGSSSANVNIWIFQPLAGSGEMCDFGPHIDLFDPRSLG